MVWLRSMAILGALACLSAGGCGESGTPPKGSATTPTAEFKCGGCGTALAKDKLCAKCSMCPNCDKCASGAVSMKCPECSAAVAKDALCAKCGKCAKCDTCGKGSDSTATYKCACGATQTVAASAPAPSC